MHPVLFRFGNIVIHTYGLFMALGFFAAIHLSAYLARRSGLNADVIWDLGLYSIVAGLIGGRLLFVVFNYQDFIESPWDIIKVFRGGLIFYGAFVAAAAACLIYLKRKKLDVLPYADTVAPGIALGHAIGRIGCFMFGCCYGKPTQGPLGVKFPPISLPGLTYGPRVSIHPTQLYESAFLFAISLLLIHIYRNKRENGFVFAWYLILYSAARFFVELFRGDTIPFALNLSFSQFMSVILFVATVITMICLPPKEPSR